MSSTKFLGLRRVGDCSYSGRITTGSGHTTGASPASSWVAEHVAESVSLNGTEGQAILLIDDNAVQAAARQTILKRAGYFVIAVLNPLRALEQFQANDFPAEIKLVITDHLMPGMTGAEFVRELRKSHKDLPVLVISGLEEAEEQYLGMDVLFRLKPLMPDHLLASVHRLITAGRAVSE